ncbi:CTD nuclear envelope phosphatase 1 -like protein, partial [Brachionus plicatilis]
YFKVIFIFCVMTIASFLMSLQYIILLLTKIWTFLTMLFKKKIRTVIQHQAITYVMCPLSPSSQYRLSKLDWKT